MKCIKNKKTGRITRVPNNVADLSVQEGGFEFVSKSAYRRQNLEDHSAKKVEIPSADEMVSARVISEMGG